MTLNLLSHNSELGDDFKSPVVCDDLSATHYDSATCIVFNILNQYSITLDTHNYPASIYAESILYMTYWFHRLRDPMRKTAIEDCLSKYLNVNRESPVVNALLSDSKLKLQANERIKQGVMVRKTVDVLVLRNSESGQQFLTLDRTVFPVGLALPGGLLRDEDEQNEAGIPSNIFAALRVTGNKVFGSIALDYGVSEADSRKYYFVRTTQEKKRESTWIEPFHTAIATT